MPGVRRAPARPPEPCKRTRPSKRPWSSKRSKPSQLLPSFLLMNVAVKVPIVGEPNTSGILSPCNKKDGKTVNSGDVLFTLETDKVSTEVTAPESGILR